MDKQLEFLRNVFQEISYIEKKNFHLLGFDVLLKALSIRDLYTEGHSKRVAIYSYCISKKMGFSGELLVKVYIGSYLHDIGKIGVPDAILLKPGRLNPLERKLIEEHPSLGHSLLSNFNIQEIKEIVLKHHERLDGKGYPLGIDASEIPIYVNVVTAADIFDALTSDRPYRKRLSLDEALSILEKEKGSALYPEVFEIAVKTFQEIGILDIQRENALTKELEQFRKDAFFVDRITGLYTFPRWKKSVESVLSSRRGVIFVIFDIKGLLFINLTKGWEKGDEILYKIGEALIKEKIGLFSRLSGGTFIGVLNKRRVKDFESLIERMEKVLGITIFHEKFELKENQDVKMEEIIGILVKRLKKKKRLTTSSGIEKLIRRSWR
jgi:GGDEF domain-containing protein